MAVRKAATTPADAPAEKPAKRAPKAAPEAKVEETKKPESGYTQSSLNFPNGKEKRNKSLVIRVNASDLNALRDGMVCANETDISSYIRRLIHANRGR
jgi:hypothetical protein